MKINKVVIPAAGRGTRLLPATKETPKEMLPIFSQGINGKITVKPLLQVIFEQFYTSGIREYCFIVGRGKGSVSDHFTADKLFLNDLETSGKNELALELNHYFSKINTSSIVFINQSEPRGFGDAVLQAKPYVNEPFFTHAGDTLLLSVNNNHVKRLEFIMEKYDCQAIFYVMEVDDPSSFGVVIGEEVDEGVIKVNKVIEKPLHPISNLAIVPFYLFSPRIFEALDTIDVGQGGELQLTDGIQKMIDEKMTILALKMNKDEIWLDMGTPESYWDALKRSLTNAKITEIEG